MSVFPHLQRNKNCASTITNSFATFEIGVISSVLHKKLSINGFPFINFNEQSDHNEKEKKTDVAENWIPFTFSINVKWLKKIPVD